MVDYAALKAEIELPDYDGMSDEQIVAAINAKTTPVDEPVPGAAVKQFFIRQGILSNATLYAEDVENLKPYRAACMTVRDAILNNVFSSFDLVTTETRAEIDTICGALIATECMTEGQRDALYAMGTVEVSWVETIVGLPSISEPDLGNARDA